MDILGFVILPPTQIVLHKNNLIYEQEVENDSSEVENDSSEVENDSSEVEPSFLQLIVVFLLGNLIQNFK